jgi:CheY-like chemotaxis protein
MPKMNGFEFLAILKNQPFHPLVLILSAHSDAIPQTVAHMVSGRLMKPFSRQTLVAMVNSLVSPSIKLPLS